MVVRAVVRRHLSEAGYVVVEADDGDAALRACRDSRPDAALLDIEMPSLDGYQVLAAMKADPELADIPVVFLTGRTDTRDLVEGLRLGAHDYLKKPFDPAELLARVSGAVRMKRLEDELRLRNAQLDVVSRTDVLTGLHNRRHAEDHLRQMASAALRRDTDLSVLLLDIDHFKSINDSYGHPAGDAVLCDLARRLTAILRAEDLAARWGGEEFLVALPMTSIGEGRLCAERIRASVADTPFDLPGGPSVVVTISVGCAAGRSGEIDKLVSEADAALYRAKAAGRDRVVVSAEGSPGGSGELG
jgi:two-component system cell cycle response regulator